VFCRRLAADKPRSESGLQKLLSVASLYLRITRNKRRIADTSQVTSSRRQHSRRCRTPRSSALTLDDAQTASSNCLLSRPSGEMTKPGQAVAMWMQYTSTSRPRNYRLNVIGPCTSPKSIQAVHEFAMFQCRFTTFFALIIHYYVVAALGLRKLTVLAPMPPIRVFAKL
jgi:hypothetical protein